MSHYDYEGREPDYPPDTSWHVNDTANSRDLEASRYSHRTGEYEDPSVVYSQTLEEFKIAAEGHAQNLQNSVLSIKHKTDHVRLELDSAQSLFGTIHSIMRSSSQPREDAYGQTSSSYSRSRYNPMNTKYTPSTFDSKLEKYKKTAEDRKSQNRSGSTNASGGSQLDARSYKALKEKINQLEVGFNNI